MLVYKHFLDMSPISHERLNKVLSSLKKKKKLWNCSVLHSDYMFN